MAIIHSYICLVCLKNGNYLNHLRLLEKRPNKISFMYCYNIMNI